MTKRLTVFAIICLILATPLGTRNAQAQDRLPLQRVQTIPMPGVSGRMDHLGVDVEGGRLFAAALGNNQNTVEVIDLKAGKRIFSTVKSFRGDSFELLDRHLCRLTSCRSRTHLAACSVRGCRPCRSQ